MLKIFISHAWEDNKVSRKLATQLRRDGAEIWIYYAQIEIGDSLPKVFSDAIDWCDIFILIWSKTSATSHSVQQEWQKALELKKTVITCLIDNTGQFITLRGFLFVNFSDFDHGYEKLAQLLNLNIIEEKQQESIPIENELIAEPIPTIMRLREKPEKLCEDDVQSLIKKFDFLDTKRNEQGHGIENQLEIQEIKGNKVIFDKSTGLMWQNGGSLNSMWYDEAKAWVTDLNQNGYAGQNDWRLPTLEEAMSLLNKKNQSDDLFIDPLFDNKQLWIWTSDLSENANRAWVVFFNYGSCHPNCFDFNNFVRAVRSKNKSNTLDEYRF